MRVTKGKMNMKSPHNQIAFSIVTRHGNVLLDDEPLDGLIEDIASALQDAFDLGFKAAGGSIHKMPLMLSAICRQADNES